MCGIFDRAVVETHREVGVVILSMGNPGHHIDEGHGLMKLGEGKTALYCLSLIAEFPNRAGGQEVCSLFLS